MPSDKVRSITMDVNDDNSISISIQMPDKKDKEGITSYQQSKKFTAPTWDAAVTKITKFYHNGVEEEGVEADGEYKKEKVEHDYEDQEDDKAVDGLVDQKPDKSYKKMGMGSDYEKMED